MTAKATIRFKNPPQLIDSIRIPGIAGILGITTCPGMRDDFIFDLYNETLIEDLQAIRDWGAAVVVTLLEEAELNALGVRELGKQVLSLNMVWLHLPVHKLEVPEDLANEKWRSSVLCLCNLLRQGQRVLVHCKEGLGRAGQIAVRLLIELGVPVHEAIGIVRKARPGSLPLTAHENYCYSFDVSRVREAGIGLQKRNTWNKDRS